MLVIIPIALCEVDRARDYLAWLGTLGAMPDHQCALLGANPVPQQTLTELLDQARPLFGAVEALHQNQPNEAPWPVNANALFKVALEAVRTKYHVPFLWLELDNIPTKSGWLDTLAEEYRVSGKPVMGVTTDIPWRHINGSAFYPANFHAINPQAANVSSGHPWDIVNARATLAKARVTPHMVRSLADYKNNVPHTFPDAESLSIVPANCLLFHGCKDGTLIHRLLEQIDPNWKPELLEPVVAAPETIPDAVFHIVFPACNRDVHLLRLNLEWMRELDGKQEYTGFFAYDATLPGKEVLAVRALGQAAFRSWCEVPYPIPRRLKWPDAPNWALQHSARAMKQFGKPWLWYEADAWPLRPGWLNTLAAEYVKAGKAVMGPVVPRMGHINGVAVYPANFCDLSPLAMTCTDKAWDAACTPDIQGKFHDAAHLMHHVWGWDGRKFTDFGGISQPVFDTPEKLAMIKPSAVMIHRVKDDSLLRMLRSRMITTTAEENAPEPKPQTVPAPAKPEAPAVAVGTKPRVEILIVSYAHDIPYLKHCLLSIEKFARGFSGVTLVIPEYENLEFREAGVTGGVKVSLYKRTMDKRKWHIHAQARKCLADWHCPAADFICHVDSDCIFSEPVTPEDYFTDGKPVMVIKPWDKIGTAVPWREPTHNALGYDPVFSFMERHPQVNPIGLYPAVRQFIEEKHQRTFEEWVLTLKPDFPWGISEHNLLGAFAYWTKRFHDQYSWITSSPVFTPVNKLIQFWSYSPPDKEQSSPTGGANCRPIDVINRILSV